MKPHIASLVNAAVLIAMSAWAYLSSDSPSPTALIPAAFGVVLLALYPGIKSANKIVAHVAVVLTLLLVFALFMPLRGAVGRGDALAILRVGLMLAATVVALVAFIKSFIDIRRQRA
ncbi:MAG: hypothetical protein AAF735_03845 [Myxococcota bacterium]